MKRRLLLLISLIFLGLIGILNAQPNQTRVPLSPFKNEKQALFGGDLLIDDNPGRDQRNVVICSAFNGWLYAAYTYYVETICHCAIVKSQDNGATWTLLIDSPSPWNNVAFTKLDILVCGNDVPQLKLFLGYIANDTVDDLQNGFVVRINANTGEVEEELLATLENSDHVRDLAIASDYTYPSAGSNPYSIAVVYSMNKIFDTIMFRTSSDGGIYLDKRYKIASSHKYFDHVAISYARSSSYNNGRYFVAWEEKENAGSTTGHLYTAHSEPDFNSPFTTPVLLDSLDPLTANKVRNPSIACQVSSYDNDSLNLTEVILCDKYIPSGNTFDVTGFCNNRAVSTANFRNFKLVPGQNYMCRPAIAYNPYDSTFMVTYYDSTQNLLPYVINNINLPDPESWTFISPGYNDLPGLSRPEPRIALNYEHHSGMNAWSSDRPGGNGMALLDAPYYYYTGIPDEGRMKKHQGSYFYPNPTSGIATLVFDVPVTEMVSISFVASDGRQMETITNSYPAGKQVLKIDISNFPAGLYHYSIDTQCCHSSGNLVLIK
jgi:hypothetical protein